MKSKDVYKIHVIFQVLLQGKQPSHHDILMVSDIIAREIGMLERRSERSKETLSKYSFKKGTQNE